MIYRNTIFTFIFNPYVVLNNDTIGGMNFTEAAGHLSIREFIKACVLWKKVHFTSVLNAILTWPKNEHENKKFPLMAWSSALLFIKANAKT